MDWRFTPAVTPLSLDEALLDLAGCERHYPSWMEAAHQIRATVRAETGLALSIGIGGTRAVAHVATALAKPKGILEVRRGEEAAFLAPLPLSYLPGVGPSLLKALERFHLHTIGDLARIPQDVLEETFGRIGISVHGGWMPNRMARREVRRESCRAADVGCPRHTRSHARPRLRRTPAIRS